MEQNITVWGAIMNRHRVRKVKDEKGEYVFIELKKDVWLSLEGDTSHKGIHKYLRKKFNRVVGASFHTSLFNVEKGLKNYTELPPILKPKMK